jgi:hypothetical protein
LELLRERGEIDRAIQLVEDMLWLDHQLGETDRMLTAGLYTHRSTLLWVQGHYHQAAVDLNRAIELLGVRKISSTPNLCKATSDWFIS